ncbi:MAG TPA: hypothetical protein VFW40_00810 [Capsulimonadaceae bacterium]|nr:hypothetical protein [Capsulimonadaceae bacterium]
MKKGLFITIATIAILAMACAIYWMQLNIPPDFTIPKPPPLPSPNAYDFFAAALKLDVDSQKAIFASDNRPPGYKDPYKDPDDRYYTLAEKKALLQESQPLLAKLRQGLQYPYATPDPDEDYFTVEHRNTILPTEYDLKELALMARFAGGVYAQERDWGSAVQCDLDAIQVGEKEVHALGELPYIDGMSCENIGFVGLWKTVDYLNLAQADAALKRLAQIDSDALPLGQAMEHKVLFDKITLLRVFSEPHWRSRYSKYSLPPSVYLWSNRAIMQKEVDFDSAWVREVRRPYVARLPLPSVPKDVFHQWQNPPASTTAARAYGGELSANRMSFWFRGVQIKTQTNLMLAALALRIYRLDNGEYPNSLAELSPKYLPTTPADPFAMNSALRYRRTGGKYLLYSVGPDGKDDGGKPIFSATNARGHTVAPRFRHDIYSLSIGDIVAGVNTDGQY